MINLTNNSLLKRLKNKFKHDNFELKHDTAILPDRKKTTKSKKKLNVVQK